MIYLFCQCFLLAVWANLTCWQLGFRKQKTEKQRRIFLKDEEEIKGNEGFWDSCIEKQISVVLSYLCSSLCCVLVALLPCGGGFGAKSNQPKTLVLQGIFVVVLLCYHGTTTQNQNKTKQNLLNPKPQKKTNRTIQGEGLGDVAPFGPHITLKLPNPKPNKQEENNTKNTHTKTKITMGRVR